MLPPVGALSSAHRYDMPAHDSTAGFYEVDKQPDDKPRYWARRRHRWVDLAPAFWVTNRSMVRARRHRHRIVRKGYLTKGRAQPSAYVRKIVALAATTDKLTAPSRLGGVAASALRIAFAQRVRPAPRSVRIAAQSFASRRSHRLLSAPMVSNIEKRRTSIWHARSTRLMRQVERGLPA